MKKSEKKESEDPEQNAERADPPEKDRRGYLKTVGALVAGLAVGGAAAWLGKPAERLPGATVTERVTETVTETVTTTTAAKEISVLGVDCEQTRKILDITRESFEKEFGITVNMEISGTGEIMTKLPTMLAAAACPYDVIVYPGDSAPGLAEYFRPIDDFIEKYDVRLDEFVPALMGYVKFKDQIIGLPWRSDFFLHVYNEEAYENVGIEKPAETWSEFLENALQVNDPPNMYAFAAQGKDFWGITQEFFAYLLSSGGEMFDENMMPMINSDIGVEALTYYVDLFHVHKVTHPESMALGYMEKLFELIGGRVASIFEWPWSWTEAQNPEKSVIVGKCGGWTVPGNVIPGRMFAGGWGTFIPKESKKAEEAFQWCNWITQPKWEKEVVMRKGDTCPVRIATLNDPELAAEFKVFEGLSKSSSVCIQGPNFPEWNECRQILFRYMHDAYDEKLTPKETLDKAAEEWHDVLEKAGYYA